MKKLLGIAILSVSASFVSPTYATDNAVMKACNQREAGADVGKLFGFWAGLEAGVWGCTAFLLTGPGYAACVASVTTGVTITGSVLGEEVGGQIDGCGGPISNRLMTPGQ